jgi:hypothetical protein
MEASAGYPEDPATIVDEGGYTEQQTFSIEVKSKM